MVMVIGGGGGGGPCLHMHASTSMCRMQYELDLCGNAHKVEGESE